MTEKPVNQADHSMERPN